jgi:hypothetical protein
MDNVQNCNRCVRYFMCGLFIGTLSISDYVASNDGWLMNSELGGMWKGAGVV